jgi:hypothetical protein
MSKNYSKKRDAISSIESQIAKGKESLEKSEAALEKDLVFMNYEKDDVEFLQKVLDQISNPSMEKSK